MTKFIIIGVFCIFTLIWWLINKKKCKNDMEEFLSNINDTIDKK